MIRRICRLLAGLCSKLLRKEGDEAWQAAETELLAKHAAQWTPPTRPRSSHDAIAAVSSGFKRLAAPLTGAERSQTNQTGRVAKQDVTDKRPVQEHPCLRRCQRESYCYAVLVRYSKAPHPCLVALTWTQRLRRGTSLWLKAKPPDI